MLLLNNIFYSSAGNSRIIEKNNKEWKDWNEFSLIANSKNLVFMYLKHCNQIQKLAFMFITFILNKTRLSCSHHCTFNSNLLMNYFVLIINN